MTCRHKPGDPNYSSSNSVGLYPPTPETPDSERYNIVDVAVIGPNLVLKVRYPNCRNCAYEGNKVLVYLGVSPAEALKWKKIDPHFRSGPPREFEAPSPSARFPASEQGWKDAQNYARNKL